jgi:hypothetical protein
MYVGVSEINVMSSNSYWTRPLELIVILQYLTNTSRERKKKTTESLYVKV